LKKAGELRLEIWSECQKYLFAISMPRQSFMRISHNVFAGAHSSAVSISQHQTRLPKSNWLKSICEKGNARQASLFEGVITITFWPESKSRYRQSCAGIRTFWRPVQCQFQKVEMVLRSFIFWQFCRENGLTANHSATDVVRH
jgi:hypothetical protein